MIALACALFGCGPALFAVLDDDSSSEATLQLNADILPALGVTGCGLMQQFEVSVNRGGAEVTYSLNGAAAVEVPDLVAGEVRTVSIALWPTLNTVEFCARVGDAEPMKRTVTIDRSSVDAVRILLEPAAVQGDVVTLAWSEVPGASSYWIYFDDESAASMDRLDGVVGGLQSPIRVDARDLGSREPMQRTFEIELQGAAPMQWFHFAVRADDGCESPIIAAHTRPRPREVSWTDYRRRELAAGAEVELAPIVFDRGGDIDLQRGIRGPDGLPDIALIDNVGNVFVVPNDGERGLGEPQRAATIAGSPISAHGAFVDLDELPDLLIATADRLYALSGGVVGGDDPWRFEVRRSIARTSLVPRPMVFLDMACGDFDGDTVLDIALSVRRPDTRTGFVILYGLRDVGERGPNWRWGSPQTIDSPGTGDDGAFSVADLDADGRDDILHVLDNRYRTLLMRGRGVDPEVGESDPFASAGSGASRGELQFADVDHDGYLDVIAIRSEGGMGSLAAMLNEGVAGSIRRIRVADTFFDLAIDRFDPNEPGRLAVADLDGDELEDLVYRRTRARSVAGTSREASEVLVHRGVRDVITGRQDWAAFASRPGPELVFAPAGSASVGASTEFAVADLNHDGSRDLCAVFRSAVGGGGGMQTVASLDSKAAWAWQRGVRQFEFAGTIYTGVTEPVAPEFGGFVSPDPSKRLTRARDLFAGFFETASATAGPWEIRFMEAHMDQGRPSGGFSKANPRRLLLPLEPSRAFVGNATPDPASDFLVGQPLSPAPGLNSLCLGHVAYGELVGALPNQPQFGYGYVQATAHCFGIGGQLPEFRVFEFAPATLDTDGRTDCIAAIQNASGVVALIPVSTNRGNFASQPLERRVNVIGFADLVVVTDLNETPASEVLVSLESDGFAPGKLLVHRVEIDETGEPFFLDPLSPIALDVPNQGRGLATVTTANFTRREGVKAASDHWIYGGGRDGSLVEFAFENGGLQDGQVVAELGDGPVLVEAADVNLDHAPDLIAVDTEAQRVLIYLNPTEGVPSQPSTTQATGNLDFAAPIELRLPKSELPGFASVGVVPSFVASARINDDPYVDVIVVRGPEVHVWYGVGSQ